MIEVELCPAVAAVVEAARPAADAKSIALSAALDETAGSIAGDRGRLRQALHELIANALRATPRGGHVGVRLSHTGAVAEIAVSDTGRGIRADLLPHLFDGFPRAGATRHGSLGVGLAIVRAPRRGARRHHRGRERGRGPRRDVHRPPPLLPAEWTAPVPPAGGATQWARRTRCRDAEMGETDGRAAPGRRGSDGAPAVRLPSPGLV